MYNPKNQIWVADDALPRIRKVMQKGGPLLSDEELSTVAGVAIFGFVAFAVCSWIWTPALPELAQVMPNILGITLAVAGTATQLFVWITLCRLAIIVIDNKRYRAIMQYNKVVDLRGGSSMRNLLYSMAGSTINDVQLDMLITRLDKKFGQEFGSFVTSGHVKDLANEYMQADREDRNAIVARAYESLPQDGSMAGYLRQYAVLMSER